MFCHSCFLHTTYQRRVPCRSIPSFGFFLVSSFLAAPKSTQASAPFGLDFLSLTRSCVCCILMLLSLNSTCGLPSTAYFFTVSQVLRHYFHWNKEWLLPSHEGIPIHHLTALQQAKCFQLPAFRYFYHGPPLGSSSKPVFNSFRIVPPLTAHGLS